jgi:phosphate uptake regulator
MVMPNFRKEEERKIEINLEEKNPEFIKKNLHAAYTKGYNVIVFKGNIKNARKMIKELLDDYLSFEIIESNHKEVVVKDFFDIKEAKFENFVRRIDNNLREMFDIVVNQSKRSRLETASLKEVNEIDKAVNKFYFLCSRIFLRGIDNPTILNILKMDSTRLFNNWWIAFHLEALGDGLKYVLAWCNKLKPKNKEDIHNILSELQQNYIDSMEAFYKKERKKAFEVIKRTTKIREKIENLEKGNSKILKITQALDIVERNVYQNAKMIFYIMC